MDKIEAKSYVEKILSTINGLFAGSSEVEIKINDGRVKDEVKVLTKAAVKSILAREYKIAITIDSVNNTIRFFKFDDSTAREEVKSEVDEGIKPEPEPEPQKPKVPVDRTTHSYVFPHYHKDVCEILKDKNAKNVWIWGPTGSGKTLYVTKLVAELDMELVRFQCRPDADSSLFFGEKTVKVDMESKQNYIEFVKGIVTKSMQTGLDKDGNEVGKPALLLLDEVGCLPPQVFIALNSVLEVFSSQRTITLQETGEKIVSHSKFRIIATANSQGQGLTSHRMMGYNAQQDAADISTLERFGVWIHHGYSKKAEKQILMEKIGDDAQVSALLEFRNKIRSFIKQGQLTTPFSTRDLVEIADQYRIFKNNMAKALYYTVWNRLSEEEMAKYNETAHVAFGVDVLKQVSKDDDMDYM